MFTLKQESWVIENLELKRKERYKSWVLKVRIKRKVTIENPEWPEENHKQFVGIFTEDETVSHIFSRLNGWLKMVLGQELETKKSHQNENDG